MEYGITFISADEGKLIFTIETANCEIEIATNDITEGAELIEEFGTADACYFSSSIDFGSEYGFANDDSPRKLYNAMADKYMATLR